jgi:hypothetical protein
MNRFTPGLILVLLAGFGIGLAYSWLISPLRVFDSEPVALRMDFKDHYRSAIAASYAATGNLPRAQVRLSLLGDADPIEALNAQAQRAIANVPNADSPQQADQLAALALALEHGASPIAGMPSSTEAGNDASTKTPPQSPDIPTDTALPTTQSPAPTLGAPFELVNRETVCDPSLPGGLLQVVVFDSSGRQLAGIRIIITWDTGEERFFTGLKPELGNGYADYIMTPNTIYSLQLAQGSDVATDLVAPSCQTPSGEPYFGGIKLTFQQP